MSDHANQTHANRSLGRVLTAGTLLLGAVIGVVALGLHERAPTIRFERVAVTQPLSFSHRTHVDQFVTHAHRDRETRWHLEKLREQTAPVELSSGKCAECHDKPAELRECIACHAEAPDPAVRGRPELLACGGCHPGVAKGDRATLPPAAVCRACHGGAAPITPSEEERKLRDSFAKKPDLAWVSLTRLGLETRSAHEAHVKRARIACTRCHEDVGAMTAPPTSRSLFPMEACVACHVANHATTACLGCHQ